MSHLDILYISDDNFAAYLGTSLKSLICNCNDMTLKIHIIDMEISDINKEMILATAAEKEIDVLFYDASAIVHKLKSLNIKAPVENNSVATLGRLFLANVIDKSVEKVLYIDCDIIINHSLKALADCNFNTSIAAVTDFNYGFFKDRREVRHIEEYFNAGVLLINVKKYNERISSTNIIQLINSRMDFADQDILNIIFDKDVTVLPPKYNSNIRCRMIKPKYITAWLKNKFGYTYKELEEAYQSPIIIHYTSSLLGRPWEKNCKDPDLKIWRHYMHSSLWSEMRLKEHRLSKSNQIGRLLYFLFPKKVFCAVDYKFAEKKFLRMKSNEKGI